MIEEKNYFIGVIIDNEASLDDVYIGTLNRAKRACVRYYGNGIYSHKDVHLIVVSEDYKVVAVRTEKHGWLNVVDYKYDKLVTEKYGAYRYDFQSKAEHAWIKV